MYARAIRPLREISLQVKVPSANAKRLIQRMRQILQEENIRMDDSIIQEIANQSNFDARSAINTLQFISKLQAEKKQAISM
jgi:DNA polymerase III delta prime subunit